MIIPEVKEEESKKLTEMCWFERSRREKVYLELELQKHQRELLIFEKEEYKPKDWTLMGLEESK